MKVFALSISHSGTESLMIALETLNYPKVFHSWDAFIDSERMP